MDGLVHASASELVSLSIERMLMVAGRIDMTTHKEDGVSTQ